jgi:hypothetical protein
VRKNPKSGDFGYVTFKPAGRLNAARPKLIGAADRQGGNHRSLRSAARLKTLFDFGASQERPTASLATLVKLLKRRLRRQWGQEGDCKGVREGSSNDCRQAGQVH